jgi:2-amino-4-hydroxy-6-hydroxymethyldihydropteridine diphosphokinase
MNSSEIAIVALGSNVGDSRGTVVQALNRLEAFSSEPILRSSLWQTTPVDCPPDSPPFINAVAGLAPLSGETPESLLQRFQLLEREFGRRPKQILNEPRPLDLDLIAFGRETRRTGALILPHPRAHQRRFVLQPLSEITPEVILPGQQKTVQELLALLPDDASMRKVQ